MRRTLDNSRRQGAISAVVDNPPLNSSSCVSRSLLPMMLRRFLRWRSDEREGGTNLIAPVGPTPPWSRKVESSSLELTVPAHCVPASFDDRHDERLSEACARLWRRTCLRHRALCHGRSRAARAFAPCRGETLNGHQGCSRCRAAGGRSRPGGRQRPRESLSIARPSPSGARARRSTGETTKAGSKDPAFVPRLAYQRAWAVWRRRATRTAPAPASTRAPAPAASSTPSKPVAGRAPAAAPAAVTVRTSSPTRLPAASNT